jgi:ABC-type antimicrobial peptide transport system permease subunit
MAENLAGIEAIFKKYNPEFPFTAHFIDENYAQKFEDEKRIGTIAGFFAILAIFVSCLGLYGLASYLAENRRKEIGIRKVLGASVFSLVKMLSTEFLILVSIGFAIASPFAWWTMNGWLQDYEYRIEIQPWVFLGAGFIALCIALATVSFHAISAAVSNPVRSLRSE